MLLDERVEAVVTIRAHVTNFAGKPYWEASLASDDGQTLHIYEGQLKEVKTVEFVVGESYRLVFCPFINNRWIEFKIVSVAPNTP